MKGNLIALINAHEKEFSKGQRRIAQYIIEHCDEAAFMTALRLGEEAQVSESTVVRFATELGFEGYPQLQRAVQEHIRSKLTIVERLEVTRARMNEQNLLQNVAKGDIGNIRRTMEEMDETAFFDAVDTLVNARQIYVFGAGSCKALAGFLTHYLKMLLGGRVQIISSSSQNEIFEEMLDIGPQDAIIGISFPRYSSKAATTLHYAQSKGAGVVAITDSPLSPIAPYASSLLLAHSGTTSIVDSLVAPMSIVNALIVAISLRTMDQSRGKLEELEHLWNTYKVYEKMDETENAQ
ncbi:MAG: MurR/RpiR family transcriptional regulator [Clostridia bacterium]|nr:MurR/RpiR family transcriptional regulator [Clostridia bacterium]